MTSSYSPDYKNPTPESFKELETTQTPLVSIAYFINEHCKDYNDDYMLCKRDNGDPAMCALEGRRVSRCVRDLVQKTDDKCKESFDSHWKCLQQNNNYYWKCRDQEKMLNQCMYKNFGYKKTIPDAPDYEVPIHMRSKDDVWYK
ncbi:hypothetical protein MIR68_005004 [Amoeboaphelidium protococcarum]|nr:hypothetical protein MIR68_005004 [Amoeboaphelidium protococcarum]